MLLGQHLVFLSLNRRQQKKLTTGCLQPWSLPNGSFRVFVFVETPDAQKSKLSRCKEMILRSIDLLRPRDSFQRFLLRVGRFRSELLQEQRIALPAGGRAWIRYEGRIPLGRRKKPEDAAESRQFAARRVCDLFARNHQTRWWKRLGGWLWTRQLPNALC